MFDARDRRDLIEKMEENRKALLEVVATLDEKQAETPQKAGDRSPKGQLMHLAEAEHHYVWTWAKRSRDEDSPGPGRAAGPGRNGRGATLRPRQRAVPGRAAGQAGAGAAAHLPVHRRDCGLRDGAHGPGHAIRRPERPPVPEVPLPPRPHAPGRGSGPRVHLRCDHPGRPPAVVGNSTKCRLSKMVYGPLPTLGLLDYAHREPNQKFVI